MTTSILNEKGLGSDLFTDVEPRAEQLEDVSIETTESGYIVPLNAYAEASQASAPGKKKHAFDASAVLPDSSHVGEKSGSKGNVSEQPADEDVSLSEHPSKAVGKGKGTSGLKIIRRREADQDHYPPTKVGEVAEYLNLSVSTVWRLAKNDPRFLKPFHIGGSTRWDRQALIENLLALSQASKTGA
jgi:predicted DNA-binding transcriptional regulator AlpA